MSQVESKIGNFRQDIYDSTNPSNVYHTAFGTDPSDDEIVLPYGDELVDLKLHEIDEAYLDSLDKFIGTEVVVPGKNSQEVIAIIRNKKRDHLGNLIGDENPNPILDTRIYEWEFPDGRVEEYSVNTILENLHQQVDKYGWDQSILKEIISFRKDNNVAIPQGENAFTTVNSI